MVGMYPMMQRNSVPQAHQGLPDKFSEMVGMELFDEAKQKV